MAPGATERSLHGKPSTNFGPVHPFGVLSTIIGHLGRSIGPFANASLRILPITRTTSSRTAAIG